MKTTVAVAITALLVLLSRGSAGNSEWASNGPYGGYFSSFLFHPQTKDLVFATEGDSFGDLYRSRNAGQTWERSPISLGGFLTARIHPLNPSTIVAAGFDVYTSTDEGSSFVRIARTPFKRSTITDMEFHPSDPQVLYAASFRGFFRSTNGGKTWQQNNSGLKAPCDEWGCRPQIEVDPANGNVIYLVLGQHVYKSNNGGTSWQSSGSGVNLISETNALSIRPDNGQVLVLGSGRGIFLTTNGGVQWSAANCTDCRVLSVAFDPKNTQIVFGAGEPTVKSTDGGRNWAQVKFPAGVLAGFRGVGIHPKENIVLLGSDVGGGIMRSGNGGMTWQTANNKLDSHACIRLASHMQRSARIFAVTYSGQLFISNNSGVSWNKAKQLWNSMVTDVKIHPANPDLVVVALNYGPPAIAVSRNGGGSWTVKGN